MRLRDKKTGEIYDVWKGNILVHFANGTQTVTFNTIAELNEYLEDVDDTNVIKKPSVEQRLEWLFKLTDEHDRRLVRIENDLDNELEKKPKKPLDTAKINELIDKIHPEPLIKNEKIRRALRAWADVHDIDGDDKLLYRRIIGIVEFEFMSVCIRFNGCYMSDNLEDKTYYSIAELCGEEE